MKGYKLDVSDYKVKIPMRDQTGAIIERDGTPVEKEQTVNVKQCLVEMLFNPALKLNPDRMFETKEIADMIRESSLETDGCIVVLDKAQYTLLMNAYNKLEGLAEHFIPFLERIRSIEETDITIN